MKNKNFRCIFETDSQSCCYHPSFIARGIICEVHLNEIFGLSLGGVVSNQGSVVEAWGPMLHVSGGVRFDAFHVMFPTKKFIEVATGHAEYEMPSTDAHQENYRLSTSLRTYIDKLSIDGNNTYDNLFRFEILRNMLVVNPTDEVTLSKRSKDVRHQLMKDVQERLNNLRTNVQLEHWVDYLKKNFSLLKNGVASDTVEFRELSAFEYFILFNVFAETMNSNNSQFSALNSNVIYDVNKGYVVIQTIINPLWIVVSSDSKYTPLYEQSKVKTEKLQQRSVKHIGLNKMADRLSPQNLLDMKSTCL